MEACHERGERDIIMLDLGLLSLFLFVSHTILYVERERFEPVFSPLFIWVFFLKILTNFPLFMVWA